MRRHILLSITALTLFAACQFRSGSAAGGGGSEARVVECAVDEDDRKNMSEANRRKFDNQLGYNITDLSVLKSDFMGKGYDSKMAEQKILGAIRKAGYNNSPLSESDAKYLQDQGLSLEFITGLGEWCGKRSQTF